MIDLISVSIEKYLVNRFQSLIFVPTLTMLNIAKIMNKTEKTTAGMPILSIMPLKGYMARIVDRQERIRVKDSLMEAMGIHSDMSWWRFVVGCSHRPSYEQREAAAEVMRHYMQNAAITGEDLFPEHLYPMVS